MKKFAWLTFLTGLLLSGVAGYYSIIGLSMVFASAFWSVAALAGILELAKIVSVTWMYRYRHLAGRLVRSYFYIAIILLMLITSMGIFGYLTRAHVGTDTVIMTSELTIAEIAQRESALIQQRTQLTEELAVATKQSNQLVTQLGQAERFVGASGAVRVQKDTSARREVLLADIKKLNAELSGIQRERIGAQTETATATADVGPLRYVARSVYGVDDLGTIRKAVVWLTVILMLVFDPMAVVLLIAANILFVKSGKSEHPSKIDTDAPETIPEPPGGNPPPPESLPLPEAPRARKVAKRAPVAPPEDIPIPSFEDLPESLPEQGPNNPLNTGVTDIPVPLWSPIDWFAKNRYLTKHEPSIVEHGR